MSTTIAVFPIRVARDFKGLAYLDPAYVSRWDEASKQIWMKSATNEVLTMPDDFDFAALAAAVNAAKELN